MSEEKPDFYISFIPVKENAGSPDLDIAAELLLNMLEGEGIIKYNYSDEQ